ncbi:coiled-coil domain-containing protein 117 isoform X3 [Nothobranchius furzeri]|uniref:Coiled-coil domain containing 117 n=7 Tax=Nothobranchius TaxID=28779 RepID=A0A1A8B6F8_NOTFU|nr:coiled-coil domain-containing protein 117 isoform X2 [Nothobranchius furzeri]KAF7200285.1 transcript variant X1 [Nothobranchius furzeri]
MHHPALPKTALGFLPTMYSFSGPSSLPDFDLGHPSMTENQQRSVNSHNSWEARRLRKHRRVDDEGCSAKKRRLMAETEVDFSETMCPASSAQQVGLCSPQPCSASQNFTLPQPSSSPPRTETESSCMEIESAQRRLQEIEDRYGSALKTAGLQTSNVCNKPPGNLRITLEDDDDEDLDVEPTQRRPVLVISDSLKEGLQCGISDILPQTVALSVTHSGMELVLWRPPEDPFCQRLKNSLQKQRKQQIASRQPPTPCPSPSLSPPSPPADTSCSPLYSFPVLSAAEEEMEL